MELEAKTALVMGGAALRRAYDLAHGKEAVREAREAQKARAETPLFRKD